MITIAWYLLKVIICSGILCGYYFLALRNKVFNRWNRFYLLAAVVISLLAPIIKINIFQNNDNKGKVIQMLQTISYGDETVIEYSRNSGFQLNTENLAEAGYLLISMVFLTIFFISLFKIKRLRKKYPETKIEDISFINTDAKGTPFSFFKSIFWNNAIDLYSGPGQQIFNHEIAHVKEKHSYDKIFINGVLIFFWINPFFWLMRKELYMIHEFIADKEALEDNDINAFAEMILQTVYPGQNFLITNNFFYSPIKRRILMLTKNKNPKVSYVSRLLVLPLAAVVFFAFTIKVKTVNNGGINSKMELQKPVIINSITKGIIQDTIPQMYYQNKKVTGLTVQTKSNNVKVTYADGATEIISKEEANKRGFVLPPPPGLPASYAHSKALFVINGKITTSKEARNIDPNEIESLDILKDSKATSKYGEKGKNGVIEISTKDKMANVPAVNLDKNNTVNIVENSLIIVDGKEITNDEMKNIPANRIESITVLKGESGELKYGQKGKNGVVEIQTKPFDIKQVTGKQNDTVPDKVFTKVETEASFPGGQPAWIKYISRQIQASIDTFTNADYGTCVVRFIVNTDGSVSDVQATTMQGTMLARVSVDAIRKGPKWIPASQKGHTVASYRLQPVTLTNPDKPKETSGITKPVSGLNDGGKIFIRVEQTASFPGGQTAWLKYLSRVFDKNGNELRSDKNNEGTCEVRFIVSKDGDVSDVQPITMKGTKLADVAVNAIKKGPIWIPGKQNGHSVNSFVLVPVTFRLSDNLMNKNEPE